jgi:hypothetical protein
MGDDVMMLLEKVEVVDELDVEASGMIEVQAVTVSVTVSSRQSFG